MGINSNKEPSRLKFVLTALFIIIAAGFIGSHLHTTSGWHAAGKAAMTPSVEPMASQAATPQSRATATRHKPSRTTNETFHFPLETISKPVKRSDGAKSVSVYVVREPELKYPFIRIEETTILLKDGSEKLVARVEAAADNMLVQLKSGATEAALEEINRRHGCSIIRHLPNSNSYLVQLRDYSPDTLPATIAAYKNEVAVVGNVDYNHLTRREPNDFLFTDGGSSASQWGLRQIRAENAWAVTTGSRKVTVAVIDTGVYLEHEDLAKNLWRNQGEDWTSQRNARQQRQGRRRQWLHRRQPRLELP